MEWEQVGKQELEQLYYEENLSDSLLAERFGVSKNEVRKKRKLDNRNTLLHLPLLTASNHCYTNGFNSR